MLNKKAKEIIKKHNLRRSPRNPFRSRPTHILQLYDKNTKKLKFPKLMKYTTKKAHQLTYHTGYGTKTYKTLYPKKKR